MDLEDLKKEAIEIADEASQMTPERGDAYVRLKIAEFPSEIRTLIITQTQLLAEKARAREAEHKVELEAATGDKQMKQDQQNFNNRLTLVGVTVGILGLAAVLLLFFLNSPLTPEQIWIGRLIASLSGAGFSATFAGTINIKGKFLALSITAAGGFAVFFLTQFLNPPSL